MDDGLNRPLIFDAGNQPLLREVSGSDLPVPLRSVPQGEFPAPMHAAPERPNYLSRLFFLLICAAFLLGGPWIVGRFVYEANYNEMKADYDVATDALSTFKPRLYDLELASRLVAKRVEPSVVSIVRPARSGFDGQGSGVIVDSAGYIVTNAHVIEGVSSVGVRLSDGRRTTASVIGSDPYTDLAVLKVNLPDLIAAEWGSSDDLEVGDLVWALGSPYGLEHSLTFGIVSAKSRRSGSYLTRSPYQEYLQTDAAVNPGNSGGPLVNIEGQIVGINAAIFGQTYQGISFAIPSTLAQEKYDELRKHGRVERAWLGIQPLEVPEAVRERLGLNYPEGVFVAQVEPGAPASRAGVQTGDVILKWNDHVATDPTLLSRAIAATEIGSIAKLELVRGDKEHVALNVVVERREQ